MTLAQTPRDAIELAVSSKVLVITGGPGVGKTTLVNSIVKILAAKQLSIVLAAPTGRAAKRMTETSGLEAKTIHRLLEFDPATGDFKRNREKPLEGNVFVIDEASMVDLVLGHQLVRHPAPCGAYPGRRCGPAPVRWSRHGAVGYHHVRGAACVPFDRGLPPGG